MKNAMFKQFQEAVKNNDSNDPVWYAGYLWLDLTARQIDDIKDALFHRLVWKGDCKVVKRDDGEMFINTPCGLMLKLEAHDIAKHTAEIGACLEAAHV